MPFTDPHPQPSIAVVIPTYNRATDLMRCLRHLETQTGTDFEVVIVDDGSTDDTRDKVAAYRAGSSLRVRYFWQANAGPATARNLAARMLLAPVCVLIGDDIFAAPDFVSRHLALHRTHPELEAVAVGLTRWAEQGQVVTPFMRWLDRDGVQFAYGELLAGTPPTWKHFYTSNLSLKTEYLRANPFREEFKRASMEDIELGYRLAAGHGLQMFFLPEAIADHLHPTTFERACLRAAHNGESAWLFEEIWPEQRRSAPGHWLRRWMLPILTEPRFILPALGWLAGALNRVWCPNPLATQVLLLHERMGYRLARQRAASSG